MCINPRLIPNPLYKSERVILRSRNIDLSFDAANSEFKNSALQYIYVPCGKCCECLQAKQNSFIQRCTTELLDSYMFFITLTYKTDSLPVVVDSLGRSYFYPSSDDVQKMFKRIRVHNLIDRDFTYCAFSEYGSKRHRPHWHIMLFVQSFPDDDLYTPVNLEHKLFQLFLTQWKRNLGTDRTPLYVPNLRYVRRGSRSNYDCHYVNPRSTSKGSADVAFYVSKYLLKFDAFLIKRMIDLRDTLPYAEYRKIRSLIRSKSLISKGFGYHRPKHFEYIDYCLRKSIALGYDFPKYINPTSGDIYPLGLYFRKRAITREFAGRFKDNHFDELHTGDMSVPGKYDPYVSDFKRDKFSKICKRLRSQNDDIDDYE